MGIVSAVKNVFTPAPKSSTVPSGLTQGAIGFDTKGNPVYPSAKSSGDIAKAINQPTTSYIPGKGSVPTINYKPSRGGGGGGGGGSSPQPSATSSTTSQNQATETLKQPISVMPSSSANTQNVVLLNQQRQFLDKEYNPVTSSSYGAWKPEYETQYYQKPMSQVGGEFLSILRGDVKSIFSKEINLQNPFNTFRGSGKRESEIKSKQYSSQIKTGTISPNESPFFTYGELQGKADLNYQAKINNIIAESTRIQKDYSNKLQEDLNKKQNDIIKEQTDYFNDLQNKVNSGELNINTANQLLDQKNNEINLRINSQVDKINKSLNLKNSDLNKDLNEKLGKIKEVRYYSKSKQSGDYIPELSKQIVETASLFNPATSSIMGAVKFSKLPNTDTYQYYNPKTEKIEILSPTNKATFGEKAEASLFLLGGMAGTYSKIKLTEKGILNEQLAQLEAQPFKFKAVKVKGENFDYDLIFGKRTYGGLTQEAKIVGKTYPSGKSGGGFIMPSGKGQITTSGQYDWTILGQGKPTLTTTIQKFDVGSKGLSFEFGKGDLILKNEIITGKAFKTIGTSTTIPTKSTGMIFSTDTSKESMLSQLQKNYKTGGTISKELGESLSMQVKPDLFFTATKKQDIGLTKVIYPKQPTGIQIFRNIGGKTTPLSKTFQETQTLSLGLFKPSLNKMGDSSIKATSELIPQTKSTSGLFSLRLIEREKSINEARVNTNSLTSSLNPLRVRDEAKVKSIFNLGVLEAPITKSRTGQGSILGLSQIQPPKEIQRPIQRTAPLFNLQIPAQAQPNPLLREQLKPFLPFAPFKSIEFGYASRGKKGYGGILGVPKYNASLGSVLLNFKPQKVSEKKLSLLSKQRYTGFELRPQITLEESKKKKRRFSLWQ